MKIIAKVQSSENRNKVTLQTNENVHSITVPPKSTGYGSSVNGGEFLFLALATCYCNDIYREAAKVSIKVERVEVEVEGEFGAEGEPAKNLSYRVKVMSKESEAQIKELMIHTDKVAEIQNTVRLGIPVTPSKIEAVSV
jgi:uncharacterized OsmC-like protein